MLWVGSPDKHCVYQSVNDVALLLNVLCVLSEQQQRGFCELSESLIFFQVIFVKALGFLCGFKVLPSCLFEARN